VSERLNDLESLFVIVQLRFGQHEIKINHIYFLMQIPVRYCDRLYILYIYLFFFFFFLHFHLESTFETIIIFGRRQLLPYYNRIDHFHSLIQFPIDR